MEINFEPNLEITKQLCVLNTDSFDIPIDMILEGDLSEYITISETSFTLGPKESKTGTGCIDAKLSLPESPLKPGKHETFIFATHLTQGGMFGIMLKVGTRVIVYVPYPGKYVEAELNIENANVNDTVKFAINAINRGNQTILDAYADIVVYDEYNEEVISLRTETVPILPNQRVEFVKTWPANVNAGEYKAVVKIFYDEEETNFSKAFRIGSPDVKIINVTAETIVNGTVGKINTTLKSIWSGAIENVYVITEIRGKERYSASIKSSNLDIQPWETREVITYWDTSQAQGPGEYSGKSTVYYLDKNESMDFTLTVIEKPGLPLSMEVIVVIVIIIVVIIFVVYMKGRKGKPKQKRLM